MFNYQNNVYYLQDNQIFKLTERLELELVLNPEKQLQYLQTINQLAIFSVINTESFLIFDLQTKQSAMTDLATVKSIQPRFDTIESTSYSSIFKHPPVYDDSYLQDQYARFPQMTSKLEQLLMKPKSDKEIKSFANINMCVRLRPEMDVFMVLFQNKIQLVTHDFKVLVESTLDPALEYPPHMKYLSQILVCNGYYIQFKDIIYKLNQKLQFDKVAEVPDKSELLPFGNMFQMQNKLYVRSKKGVLYELVNNEFKMCKNISGLFFHFCDSLVVLRHDGKLYSIQQDFTEQLITDELLDFKVLICTAGVLMLESRIEKRTCFINLITREVQFVNETYKIDEILQLSEIGMQINDQLLNLIFKKKTNAFKHQVNYFKNQGMEWQQQFSFDLVYKGYQEFYTKRHNMDQIEYESCKGNIKQLQNKCRENMQGIVDLTQKLGDIFVQATQSAETQ
ncbi:Hypothetical_protein [Hexamita inflata]|uniref:Hypothetical_protein n=1 Tax=Hexamita inflata TaxID=28002 RepID=A0ABP1GHZ8_9EUKA